MSKFSSFKESKMLFENWRGHLSEVSQPLANVMNNIAKLPDEDQKTLGKALSGGEEQQLNEDGHTDVASACRSLKTSIEDAQQMLNVLMEMDQEADLPSWWMKKAAIASDYLDKMRNYLLY